MYIILCIFVYNTYYHYYLLFVQLCNCHGYFNKAVAYLNSNYHYASSISIFTVDIFKGQGQGREHFDCEYLVNVDEYGKVTLAIRQQTLFGLLFDISTFGVRCDERFYCHEKGNPTFSFRLVY